MAPQGWLRGRTALVSVSHICPSSGRISISASTTFKVRSIIYPYTRAPLFLAREYIYIYISPLWAGSTVLAVLNRLHAGRFRVLLPAGTVCGSQNFLYCGYHGKSDKGLRLTTHLHLCAEIRNECGYTSTELCDFIG